MNFWISGWRGWYVSLPLWRAAVVTGLVCWGISFFLYSPPFWLPLLGEEATASRINDFAALCRNPLERHLTEPILAYRITTPVLAWLLGLRGPEGMVIQYVAIVGMLGIVFAAMDQKVDRFTAFWATLGVAVSFTIIWTNGLPGFPDSVTHLAAAILLLSRNSMLTVLLTVVGMMNDERFALAVPFLLVWHADCSSVKSLVASSWRQAAAFAAGALMVFGLRHALTVGWIGPGIVKPQIYEGIAKTASSIVAYPWLSWPSFGLNILMSYRTLWVVVIVALFCQAPWLKKSVVAIALLLVVAAAGIVADVSRSIGFAFPAFLLAVQVLVEQSGKTPKLLAMAVMGCLLTPSFHVQDATEGIDLQVQYPLPISLLRAEGIDVLSVFR